MPRTPAKPLPASTTQQAIPPHLSEEATRIANDRVPSRQMPNCAGNGHAGNTPRSRSHPISGSSGIPRMEK